MPSLPAELYLFSSCFAVTYLNCDDDHDQQHIKFNTIAAASHHEPAFTAMYHNNACDKNSDGDNSGRQLYVESGSGD